MSTSLITGTGESTATHLDVTFTKRENIRQTLETIHSQSNSLLLLALQWKELEDYFDSISDAIAKRVEEIDLKYQQFEWKQKYLKKKLNEIELKEKKLEEELKFADDRCKEVDATYKLVEKCYRTLREKEKGCENKLDRVLCKAERLREFKHRLKRNFEKKELELELRELQVDNRDHELNLRETKLGFIERKLYEKLEEVELKENRLNDRVSEIEGREKMLEMKEKAFEVDNDVKVKPEPVHDWELSDDVEDEVLLDPSYADLRLNVTMDGIALQMFLNGRVNDHEILRDEVISGLQLSSDPAKLVLDSIQGFYPEDSRNEDMGFDLNIVRKSSILLLEQLIKIKPRIKTHVRERVMRIAIEWKGKMNVGNVDHYLEVVGFLQLVATYGLIGEFCKDELLVLFKSCARYDRAHELCRNLGFADDIHVVTDIIQDLVIRLQPFEAIRLVYAFELVDIFPPVPILKAHLTSTFTDAEKLYENGDHSVEAQIKCISTKLDVLDCVVRCIKEYGLDSKYPFQELEQLISELKIQKRKCKASAILKTENGQLRPLDTEPFATENKPTPILTTDASRNSTSPSPSQAGIQSLKAQPQSPKAQPQSPTRNKRPRLASVVVPKDSRRPSLAPVNPHWSLYAYSSPLYYLEHSSTRGSYGGYTVQPYYGYH